MAGRGGEYFSWGLSLLFARAETYIAGQVGYTLAQDTTNGKATETAFSGLPSGTSVSNATPNKSLMYGMKRGDYLKSTPWLEIKLESFITTLQRPQQRLTLGVPGLGAFQSDEGGATNRLIVPSPSLLARYQAGAFEPYVGIGPGLLFLHQQLLISMAGSRSYSHQTQEWAAILRSDFAIVSQTMSRYLASGGSASAITFRGRLL